MKLVVFVENTFTFNSVLERYRGREYNLRVADDKFNLDSAV